MRRREQLGLAPSGYAPLAAEWAAATTIGGIMASEAEMAETALALDGVAVLLKMGMDGEQELTPDLCALMRSAVIRAIRTIDPDMDR